jgi:hypothetical protein
MNNIKSISAKAHGVEIYYEHSKKTVTVPYDKSLFQNKSQNIRKEVRQGFYMNPIQRNMYRRLMYGLKDYTQAEIASMDKYTQEAISRDYEAAKAVVHKLKYEEYYAPVDKLFNAIFPNAKIGSRPSDILYAELPSLKELKITTQKVCQSLMNAGLLPRNFFSITPETLAL